MVDFATARRGMIDSQVSSSSVTERRLLNAMGRIPRELFVPEHRRNLAYLDDLHDLGGGRFMPAPAVFARLVQLANVAETDHVLELGAGMGYGTAVLAALGKQVHGLEPDAALAGQARANLRAAGVTNATVAQGTLSDIGDQRFDAIIVEGALDGEPADLLTRLNRGGRLVAVIRHGRTGIAYRFIAKSDGVHKEKHFDATLPPLYPAAHLEQFVF